MEKVTIENSPPPRFHPESLTKSLPLLSPEFFRETPDADRVGCEILGEAQMAAYESLSSEVMAHNRGVGQLMYHSLHDAGVSEKICELGAFMGLIHDLGKLDPKLQAATSGEPFTEAAREEYRVRHSQAGATEAAALLMYYGDARIWFGGYGALYHHALHMAPQQCEDEVLAYQLTALMQPLDAFHAMAVDRSPSRNYIEKREGHSLRPQDVYRLALERCVPEVSIDGVVIDMRAIVSRYLGLDADCRSTG